MFWGELDQVTEQDLVSLSQDQIPESLTLEFKRHLNLAVAKEKAEAAKDVSALANTAGGRIVYGLDEEKLPDGSLVAGAIHPILDGTIDSRLQDVLVGNIHPRPRFRTHRVPVASAAGFVLIVEVYPAYSSDLHMVTGFKEYRFYCRGEKGTILMTEPEVRETYARIAASRQALDASMEAAIAAEIALVPKTHESVIVVPWFGHRDLVNPQRLGGRFGNDLVEAGACLEQWNSVLGRLDVCSDGFRAFGPEGDIHECRVYGSVRRNGVVHLAHQTQQDPAPWNLPIPHRLDVIVAALSTARFVLEKCAYWGPVRIIHKLRMPKPFFLTDPTRGSRWESLSGTSPVPPGEYDHTVPEFNFREHGSQSLVLRELLHQVFQTSGEPASRWYDESGNVRPELMKHIRPDLYAQLSQ